MIYQGGYDGRLTMKKIIKIVQVICVALEFSTKFTRIFIIKIFAIIIAIFLVATVDLTSFFIMALWRLHTFYTSWLL